MFIEKLNIKQDGSHIIEEMKVVDGGEWQGTLLHDNVNHETLTIYTQPKLEGIRIDEYLLSNPIETPWKTYVRVFTDHPEIYIVYESKGDQVEALDINLLQDTLVDEIDRAINREDDIDTRLIDEIERSEHKDVELNTKLDSEISRAVEREDFIDDKLVQETNRAITRENQIDGKLDNEINRAKSREDEIADNLDNEITRATIRENYIDNKLDIEITRSVNRDNTLDSKIDTEINRATTEEKRIDTKLIAETSRSITEDERLDTKINTEINRATTREDLINDKLDDEISRAISKENQIETNLGNEITRSTNKDDDIDANLNTEISRSTSKDNDLDRLKASIIYVDTELNKKYDKERVYTKEEVGQLIEDLIDGSPDALDTLREISEALNNDPNFAATMTTELSKKVDKIVGKSLSDENYTLTEKNKLAGVESGANKYIHPSSHPASFIIESATKRFVTDAEKTNWDAKETPSDAQAKANVAESNAKDYTDSHINDTVKHITSTERTNWNNANSRKHDHSNKTVIDKITQVLLDSWNSAVTHISDAIKHITSAERIKWNTVDNKSDKAYVDAELNKKFDKSGGIVSGEVRAANLIAGNEFTIGNNSTTVGNERFKFSYNSSNGRLELWRYTSAGDWVLSTEFPTRAGVGGIIVEGDSVATETYVDNKVKTDVPLNAKFTDTLYNHPSTHPPTIIAETASKRFVTDTEKAAWNAKADKVDGKGFSDENYTLIEKNKLAGIAANANNYTHPSSHPASFIIESATKRFVTDTEKAAWNDANSRKHDHSNKTVIDKITQVLLDSWNNAVTHISDAIRHITSDERTKWNTVDNKADKAQVLTNVPANAKFTDTIYTHPSSHPPTIIAQNATNRFVTDTEKSTWNAKETPSGAQAKATKALNDAKSYIEGLNYITNEDTRAVNSPPSFYGGRRVTYEFKQTSVLGLSGALYAWLSTYNPWSGHQASHITSQIAIIGRDIYTRQATSVTTWGPWSRIFTQGTPLTCNDLKGV